MVFILLQPRPRLSSPQVQSIASRLLNATVSKDSHPMLHALHRRTASAIAKGNAIGRHIVAYPQRSRASANMDNKPGQRSIECSVSLSGDQVLPKLLHSVVYRLFWLRQTPFTEWSPNLQVDSHPHFLHLPSFPPSSQTPSKTSTSRLQPL